MMYQTGKPNIFTEFDCLIQGVKCELCTNIPAKMQAPIKEWQYQIDEIGHALNDPMYLALVFIWQRVL